MVRRLCVTVFNDTLLFNGSARYTPSLSLLLLLLLLLLLSWWYINHPCGSLAKPLYFNHFNLLDLIRATRQRLKYLLAHCCYYFIFQRHHRPTDRYVTSINIVIVVILSGLDKQRYLWEHLSTIAGISTKFTIFKTTLLSLEKQVNGVHKLVEFYCLLCCYTWEILLKWI